MAEIVRLEGSDFVKVSRALRAAGEGEMRKALYAEARAIAKPILEDMRRSVKALDSRAQGSTSAARAAKRVGRAESAFGHSDRQIERALGRSGLRENVARSLRIVARDSGYRAGVYIRSEGSRLPQGQAYLPRGLDSDKGWRHPVFGAKSAWVQQFGNPPGWFRSTAGAHRGMASRRLQRTADRYVDQLAARLQSAAAAS